MIVNHQYPTQFFTPVNPSLVIDSKVSPSRNLTLADIREIDRSVTKNDLANNVGDFNDLLINKFICSNKITFRILAE